MVSPAKIPSAAYLDFVATFLAAHPDVGTGSMFGMRCLTRDGRAFAGGFARGFVVKLRTEDTERARLLLGSEPFDPSGKGRPMREWTVLPASLSEHWHEFALLAYDAST